LQAVSTYNQNISVAVILTDASREILWVNPEFTEITGYTLAEVIGKKPSILQGKNTRSDTIQRIRRKLERCEPFSDEILNYRKNGEEYPCRLVVHPIFSHQGTLTNFIAFEVDGSTLPDSQPLSLLNIQDKYRTSSLSTAQEWLLFQRLTTFMKSDKPYLDPHLTLPSLAEQLETNTSYLSQVINKYHGSNFQSLINDHRIEAFKELVVQPDANEYTLFGLANRSGFYQKSTFYKVFKEKTGITPGAYLKMKSNHSES